MTEIPSLVKTCRRAAAANKKMGRDGTADVLKEAAAALESLRLQLAQAEATFDKRLDALADADQKMLREFQARAEGAEKMVEMFRDQAATTRAAALEEAAKMAEDKGAELTSGGHDVYDYTAGAYMGDIAAAIRALATAKQWGSMRDAPSPEIAEIVAEIDGVFETSRDDLLLLAFKYRWPRIRTLITNGGR